MSAISDYLEEKFLAYMLQGDTLPDVTPTYLSLHDGPVNDTGDNEIYQNGATNGYNRQKVDPSQWTSATEPGVFKNSVDIVFGPATADWPGPVQALGIWDTQTPGDGNFLFGGGLSSEITVSDGEQKTLTAESIIIRMD